MLASRGRLAFSLDVQEWINQSEQISGLRFIAVDNKIAYRAVSLPDPFHADPADRIIVATARQLDATLVTNDEKIRAYSHVRTMW